MGSQPGLDSPSSDRLDRHGAAGPSYRSWSLQCYRQRIRPVLQRYASDNEQAKSWIATCDPGPEASTEARLFPGSLLVLWAEAFGGPQASRGLEPVAAALECLHNSSLIHDDILDGHTTRRRQTTLAASHGLGVALLAGDGLVAAAMELLGTSDDPRTTACLRWLGRATARMIEGQLMDEPYEWSRITAAEQEDHWRAVCDRKLSLGNVAGPIGARWADRVESETAAHELLRNHSVISQIINDFGDATGWTGYHELAPAIRPRGHEAERKPTLPSIWATADPEPDVGRLLQRAMQEINRRKEAAMRALAHLELEPSRRPILEDYLTLPTLPTLSGRRP